MYMDCYAGGGLLMLGYLVDLILLDADTLQRLPLWAMIAVLVVWFVPVGVCIWRDQNSLFTRWAESRNTIHTVFWLSVMLALPCVGSVLYLLGSLLPSVIWEHRGGTGVFPWSFRLRKWQLLTLSAAIAVPVFLQTVFSGAAGTELLTKYDWSFETSFLCVTAMLFLDWFLTVQRCSVYLRLSPRDHEPVPAGEVLGVPRFRTAETAVVASNLLRQRAKLMRRMVDEVFSHHVYDSELPGKRIKIQTEDGEQYCRVIGTKQDWLGDRPDFMELRYIGRGITRCRICTWEEHCGKPRCIESILYRAVPGLSGWAKRAVILLTVQAAFGSFRTAELHMQLLHILTDMLSGV